MGHGDPVIPVADREFDRVVSLPIWPGMTDDDVERVVAAIEQVLRPRLLAGDDVPDGFARCATPGRGVRAAASTRKLGEHRMPARSSRQSHGNRRPPQP